MKKLLPKHSFIEFTPDTRPEAQKLLNDIRSKGYEITSLGELVSTPEAYPDLIPLLTRHILSEDHPIILETIARSLSVSYAKGTGAFEAILERLKTYPDDGLNRTKFALCNALDPLLEKKDVSLIIPLALDPIHGPSRVMLVIAINKYVTPEGYNALQKLTRDSDEWVSKRALQSLSQKKWDKFRT
jgi:hypothetical protein